MGGGGGGGAERLKEGRILLLGLSLNHDLDLFPPLSQASPSFKPHHVVCTGDRGSHCEGDPANRCPHGTRGPQGL